MGTKLYRIDCFDNCGKNSFSSFSKPIIYKKKDSVLIHYLNSKHGEVSSTLKGVTKIILSTTNEIIREKQIGLIIEAKHNFYNIIKINNSNDINNCDIFFLEYVAKNDAKNWILITKESYNSALKAVKSDPVLIEEKDFIEYESDEINQNLPTNSSGSGKEEDANNSDSSSDMEYL